VTTAPGLRPDRAQRAAGRYAWYVIGVLMLAYAFAFLDRQILALMVEPIKRDLGISDFRMSLLLGLAFAIFYTVLGVPIARLADRSNRRNLIAAGIVLWSFATAACGLARTYGQLFVGRMCVGIGEAVLSPAALSLISDYFPREKLARAISVYTVGMSTGGGIATLAGALLLPRIMSTGSVTLPLVGDVHPWQAVFVAVGLPGILVALLTLTIREPERRGSAERKAGGIPLRQVLAYLRENQRTFVGHFLGMSVLTIMGYGVGYWIPSFFIRSYGLTPGEASHYLFRYGLISTIVGAAGIVAGGWLADRLFRRSDDGYIKAVLCGVCLLLPGYTLFALMPTPELALLALIPAVLGGSIPVAGGAAALMVLAPNQMRAQVSALYYFTISLLGLGLGPSLVAFFTDFVFRDESSLRYSIAIVSVVAATLAAILLMLLRRPFRATVAAARDWKG
jgi:MFS family permease